jgi:hypothetical protein
MVVARCKILILILILILSCGCLDAVPASSSSSSAAAAAADDDDAAQQITGMLRRRWRVATSQKMSCTPSTASVRAHAKPRGNGQMRSGLTLQVER